MALLTRSSLAGALMLAASLPPGSHAAAADLVVRDAWARATPPGASVAAGYLAIENRGATADRLVSARSEAAGAVALHETVERDGVTAMRPLAGGLAVTPGSRVELTPGGAHLMLDGLVRPLREGEAVPVTLVFETAGDVTIDFAVLPIGARPVSDRHGAEAHSEHEGRRP